MTNEEKRWAARSVRWWLRRLLAQMAAEHEVRARELREAAK